MSSKEIFFNPQSFYRSTYQIASCILYKVVQIWPGLFTLVYTQSRSYLNHLVCVCIYIYIYIYIYHFAVFQAIRNVMWYLVTRSFNLFTTTKSNKSPSRNKLTKLGNLTAVSHQTFPLLASVEAWHSSYSKLLSMRIHVNFMEIS